MHDDDDVTNQEGPPPRKRKRADRRHHRHRMIARARRSLMFMSMSLSDRDRFARKAHDHLASCSCWMCGNPRRWLGEPTRQERVDAAFRPLVDDSVDSDPTPEPDR